VGPTLALLAQLTSADPPRIAATRTPSPPTIDGRIDDAVWSAAPPITAFTQKFPDEGKAPSDPTTMRILYDDDALYIAFECKQQHATVVDRLTRRDREIEADRVTVVIGSRGDRKTAYELTVYASGTIVDAIRYDDTERSTDWDENWEAHTARTPVGWTAELRVPLRILRFAGGVQRAWDFQARRYISEKQEIDEWAYIPRDAGGEVSRYGYLDALGSLRAPTALELRPFVLGKLRRTDAGSTTLESSTTLSASGGLDLKWHVTPALTLDATVNPDFAQVEADQQILNLTTFETYYPEKRPFFLEGIDLFTTPRQLVYTRRIGRAATTPTLRTDPPFAEQLVDVPTPATIYAAEKLTGTIAEGWQIGTLSAVTQRNEIDVQAADGSRSRRLVDPLSSYQALRLKRALPGNAYVGVLATSTTRSEGTLAYPSAPASPGLLCPSGVVVASPSARCFNDAYAGAVDWRWRSGNGDWVTGGQLIGTTLHEGPARPVRDGTLVAPGEVGTGAFAYLNKEGGKHWVGAASAEYEGRRLDYNDLGYNQRSNDYRWRLDVEYRELERWWKLLESRARFEYFGRTNLDGLVIGGGYQANVSGKLTNFWEFFTEVHWRPHWFDDREVGDGTALERAGLFGHELELSSDPTKRVSFKLSTQTQFTTEGFIENGDGGVLVRALPQLDVELLPTWVYTFGEPRFAELGPAPNQYVFGRLEAKSLGTTLRATYTFTPRITLQAYGQLFLASGHYSRFTEYTATTPRSVVHFTDLAPLAIPLATNPDFQQGVLNLNVVFRWEYTLGSTLYLVYTRAQTPAVTLAPGEEAALSLRSVSRAPAADVVLVKLTYFFSPG
jgi:hypothetical protein